MVPDLFGQPEDLTIYNDLLNEIQNSGVDQEKLWQLWHNDSHLIGKWQWVFLQNFFTLVKDKAYKFKEQSGLTLVVLNNYK